MADQHEDHAMGKRGVTRPMAEHEDHERHGCDQDEHGHGGHDHGDGGHEMSRDDRLQMLRMHHKQTLWVYWTIVVLGFWVLFSPLTFDYGIGTTEPSGGRGVWFGEELRTELRVQLMTWSDIVSGILLIVFGWRTLTPNRPISLWMCCFIGIWLSLAPILFWCPSAVAYLNATFVGALLIALTILIPGMPNMIMYMQMGPPTPPGWTYNPSSWNQRWILIATGFAGWVVSRYLAAFQLGYVNTAWDPFFGDSTRRVLNSDMSHMWPISDAAFGSLAYTFEFLMGYMGSPARWRTMPWMVAFFGILVIPLGLTHILLVISQPLIVHHWCMMCLLAAGIMLPMIPLEVDEVVAMFQHLVQAKRKGSRGGSLWKIFWKGGSAEGCTPDERSPELIDLPQKPGPGFKSMIWGVTFPVTLVVASALGAWLMFAPAAFGIGIETRAADIGHLCGALILTVSVVCMAEVLRIGRYLNLLLGAVVAVGPWVVGGSTTGYSIACLVTGLAVIGLSFPRGPKHETYGLWDKYVR